MPCDAGGVDENAAADLKESMMIAVLRKDLRGGTAERNAQADCPRRLMQETVVAVTCEIIDLLCLKCILLILVSQRHMGVRPDVNGDRQVLLPREITQEGGEPVCSIMIHTITVDGDLIVRLIHFVPTNDISCQAGCPLPAGTYNSFMCGGTHSRQENERHHIL